MNVDPRSLGAAAPAGVVTTSDPFGNGDAPPCSETARAEGGDATLHDPAGAFAGAPEAGEIYGYRLIQRTGVGGMGEVWRAEQQEPRRVVALKLIKPGMDSAAVVARFKAEREALALMNHPYIASVHEAGTSQRGRPYFTMEYVPGEPITTYCDRHKLSIRHRLELFRQVCEGVQHAHTKGILHRDLKASNVLVTERDGRPVPKVIDFGVAKALHGRLFDQTQYTELGRMIGTAAYMSPEQADSGGLDLDTRSDVYSLGVLLYELLTGALPFDPVELGRKAYEEVRRIIREDDPPHPSTHFSEVTESSRIAAAKRAAQVEDLARTLRRELEWIPLMAMRKERTQRYDSAARLAEDVENYLEGRPLIAAPESRTYRLKKLVRRHRGKAAAAATVLLALLLGLAGTSWQWWRAAQAQRLADANRNKAESQLRRANASLAFTKDILNGVDPDTVQGRDVSVLLEVLERAERQLEEDLPDPLARSAHLHLIGDLYHRLGDTRRAAPLLADGLEGAREAFDAARSAGALSDNGYEPVINLSEALQRQSRFWLALGRNILARQLAEEAFQVSTAYLPAAHFHRAIVTASLAATLQQCDKPQEAGPLLEDAQTRMHADPAAFSLKLRGMVASNVGQWRTSTGDLEGAAAAYAEAHRLYTDAQETETVSFAVLRLNQSILAYKQRDFERAGRYLDDVTALWDRLLDDDLHPSRRTEWELRARLLDRAGEHQAAVAAQQRVCSIIQAKAPHDYLSQSAAARGLAAILVHAGRLGEAVDSARRAVELLERSEATPDDPALLRAKASSLVMLGEALAAGGEIDQAENIIRKALARCEEQSGSSPEPDQNRAVGMARARTLATARSALGGVLLQRSAVPSHAGPRAHAPAAILDEAEGLLLAAEEAFRLLMPDSENDVEPDWRKAVSRLARVKQAQGDTKKASEWLNTLGEAAV